MDRRLLRGGLRTIDGDVGLRVDANSGATFDGLTVAPLLPPGGRP